MVLAALKQCNHNGDCTECPYWYKKFDDDCTEHLAQDAIAVINQIAKERDEAIEQLRPSLPCGTGRGKDRKENEE